MPKYKHKGRVDIYQKEKSFWDEVGEFFGMLIGGAILLFFLLGILAGIFGG